MTNKEAIRILGLECDEWDVSHCTASERREAFEMAITALENAKNDNLTPESAQNVQKQALKMQKSDALGAKTGETCSDTISRQAAIDKAKELFDMGDCYCDKYSIVGMINSLPSVQPETCDTCKHGYFGDEQCSSCRVRFTSHYERRTDD